MQLLLSAGAEAYDKYNIYYGHKHVTPMAIAAQHGHADAVKMLLADADGLFLSPRVTSSGGSVPRFVCE